MTFHISPSTGNPNSCGAKPGNCPFGGDESHFESKAAARDAFESKQGSSVLAPTSKQSASPVEVSEGEPKLWARVGGRRVFEAEVAEILIEPGKDIETVARLQDGSFLNIHGLDPLYERGEIGDAAELFRRELIEKAGESNPLSRVINGDFPLDEARDYLQSNPEASVRDAAEAAFSATLALADDELKDKLYQAAHERGGEVKGAILNEYVDYADLVELAREPRDSSSVEEPRTKEGREVAEATNPLSQAFYTFRGKTDIDPVSARDVLEQTFPASITGLSEKAQAKVFAIAQVRADNWGSFVEEYRRAAEIASYAKGLPKCEGQARLPRNAGEVATMINTKAKAKIFLKSRELYAAGRGENVRASVSELTEELRSDERFQALFKGALRG